MLKLMLGIGVEILAAVLFAGLILALAIPLLNRSVAGGVGESALATVIVVVLAGTVGVALFRPGSTIRRHMKR
jgi:hypothetical protein